MIEGLIAFVIAALVIGLIAGVLILLVRRAPFIPSEFKAIVEWVIIVVAVLALLMKALPLIGADI
jgi:fructose-specific phosphotransferase system IIC component